MSRMRKFLEARGFDKSVYRGGFPGRWVPRCSQCEAVCVNGVATHETGCPNQTHKCPECGQRIKKSMRICGDCHAS